jgi:amyloid beta precursor protein binding protein 1
MPIDNNIAKEACRYEDCKLHPIAAIMGGIASQEAVKLITH